MPTTKTKKVAKTTAKAKNIDTQKKEVKKVKTVKVVTKIESKKIIDKKEKIIKSTDKVKKMPVVKDSKATIKIIKEVKTPKNAKAKIVKLVAKETEEDKKQVTSTENNLDEGLARQATIDTLFKAKAKTKIKFLKTQPKSMGELLEKTGYQLKGLKKGQEVLATITDKSKKTVFFDIGSKTEGILLEKEMDGVKDYLNYLESGDTVKVLVVNQENEKGQILLSLAKTANDWKWSLFEKYLQTQEAVEVRGLDINKGGMIARFMNVRGFIPVSQFGRQWMGKLDQLYNKVFSVKVIEVDKDKNRLIFSEKAVSESEILRNQQDMISKVKVGNKYKGQVSGVMPFGIFVRVFLEEDQKDGAFLDGLVHISELSWEKVNDVTRLYKVGDIVDVQVIDVDATSGKLNLSIKRMMDDPWSEIAQKYPVDAKIKGKVTRLATFGIFVEIEKGIEGLIHVSKVPSDMQLKNGDKVDCYIESLDKQNHRISLGVVLSAKPVGYK